MYRFTSPLSLSLSPKQHFKLVFHDMVLHLRLNFHDLRRSMVYVSLSFTFMLAVFFVVEFDQTSELVVVYGGASTENMVFSKTGNTSTSTVSNRKLLASADDGNGNGDEQDNGGDGDGQDNGGNGDGHDNGGDGDGKANGGVNRMGTTCSKGDIVIFQGPTAPLPNGIPTYTVQVLNVCVSGCSISNIHLSCGWFSSARLINPSQFRRICYDDCLVNNGGALGPGESLSFQYANSFQYPLSVSSVSC